jgi:hypothetical protein
MEAGEMRTTRVLTILVCLLVTTKFAFAGPGWIERSKLLALDGAVEDLFGYSVAISGDYAIVGTPYDDDNGSHSGSAYTFKWDGTAWVQQQKLLASDGAASDSFGYSVSISGDYAVVGALSDDDNGADSGSAYIFKWNGTAWVEQQKLLASDGAAKDYFGVVAICGDYVIVGAYLDDSSRIDAGSAYIFKRDVTTWTQQAKLTASDGATEDYFGLVAISGDYAIVGAYGDDDKGTYSGSAYIFHWDGTMWTQQQKLLASDGAASDYFGQSVSISGDYAIVGAPYDDDNGSHSGSAYIFYRDGTTWLQQAKLLISDGYANDWFGCSVSISGDYAIVGANGDDSSRIDAGSAYIFKRDVTTWTQQAKLTATDGATEDYFGTFVAIDTDSSSYSAIVGIYSNNLFTNNFGAAYVFGFCPRADLNDDCKVDLADFATFADWWLYGI